MNTTHFVPEVTTIEDVYPSESQAHQKQRWEHLLAKFQERYGHPAEFISRAPGRVNIIGEVCSSSDPPRSNANTDIAAH